MLLNKLIQPKKAVCSVFRISLLDATHRRQLVNWEVFKLPVLLIACPLQTRRFKTLLLALHCQCRIPAS